MVEEHIQRKLTTILAADVEGYSRLMSADEETTLKTLKTYREIIDGLIARHDGRIFGTAGDSVVAEFGSAVEAVRCAMSIQEELRVRNAELVEDLRMMFRIGINVGDLMVEGDNLFGDGVNVAARLEGIAEAGGICISGSTFDQVKNKLSIGFEDIGPQEVKNIPEPVPAFRIVAGPVSVAATKTPSAERRWRMPALAAAVAVVVVGGSLLAWNLYQQSKIESALAAFEKEAAFPLPDKPSIAVLAFDNLSGDPEREFFADGLSENIITRLASITGMFVIARNSSFKYKGKQIDVWQVGKELGVRYVLEGSVLRAEGRIRVNAQLIDAITGNHLWAEKYDRELNDLFDVLDEITLKVVTQLEVKLMMGDHARVIAHATDNVAALENQLLARKAFLKFDRENNLLSRELSRKSSELDPKFAWAIAQEGWTHAVEVLFGWSKDRADSLRQAESMARRALAADPESQFAYSLLRLIHVQRGRLDEAIVAGRRAMELSPNDAYPIGLMSHLLVWAGQPEEGVVLINKALRLEPYPSASMLHFAGDAYHFSGQYDEAIPWYRKHLEQQQRGAQAQMSWQFLIASHVELGQIEEARAEVGRLLEMHPDFSIVGAVRLVRAHPFKDHSFLDHHIEMLRKAGMPE